MLNFTEKYMQMTQEKIIYGKNNMEGMRSILLFAQDDKKFAYCGIRFTTDDSHRQAIQLLGALMLLSIGIDPDYSQAKKELFLKSVLNCTEFIGPIRISEIENPNLIVFGGEACSSERSGDPEEDKLPPYERKNKKDMIIVMAVERNRPNCVISWHSNVEKKNGQLIITETSKQQNSDEEIELIPEILSQSYKFLDEEDPMQALRPQH